MKTIFVILLILFCIGKTGMAQNKIPLTLQGSHLASTWTINDTINAQVFLESGFPKMVIHEKFAKEHFAHSAIHTTQAPEKAFVSLWSATEKYKILYFIEDTLTINGKKTAVHALVVDFTPIKAWRDYDIIFPVHDLNGCIEINITDGYMKVPEPLNNTPTGFFSYPAHHDEHTNGLYIQATLHATDTMGRTETLSGNFLMDLGAGNTFILNRNSPAVETFIAQADRMLLKDTTRFNAKGKKDLAIIIPHKITLENIELKKQIIPALRFSTAKLPHDFAGCIGNAFFKNFVVIFDFTRSIIYLKPQSDNVVIYDNKKAAHTP